MRKPFRPPRWPVLVALVALVSCGVTGCGSSSLPSGEDTPLTLPPQPGLSLPGQYGYRLVRRPIVIVAGQTYRVLFSLNKPLKFKAKDAYDPVEYGTAHVSVSGKFVGKPADFGELSENASTACYVQEEERASTSARPGEQVRVVVHLDGHTDTLSAVATVEDIDVYRRATGATGGQVSPVGAALARIGCPGKY